MKFSTAVARLMTVGVLMALAGSAATQEAYPNKPMRIISAFPPGGGAYMTARLIGEKLTESWGQQVVVDSRPGGNTIIASEALVRSPPDGYTVLIQSMIHAINPSLYTLPYDSIKDFVPVGTLTRSDYALVLNPSVPANNLKEFIALAKSRPGQLNYASVGAGSSAHLAAELLSLEAGIKLQHVPYKGVGQILPDLMGGQIQAAFLDPVGALPMIRSGKLKAMALSAETRNPALPQVPTFIEAGLPGVVVRSWRGVFVPAGTPKEIIDKLSTEIAKILVMPDIKGKLDSLGVEPFISTPEQFAALIKAEIAKFAKIVKAANIKLKN